MPRLIAAGIIKSFADCRVLRGVDLALDEGEAIALLGPSGSGKSTLLNILGSLDRPDAGSVRFGDVAVETLKGRELNRYRAECVGFVFQEHHLLPQLSAIENVLLPILAVDGAPKKDDPFGRAQDLLERLGLTDKASQLPATLSGGERQRVALARALMNGPKLLLGDEPTGNLDRENGDALVDLLLEEAHERGTSVLVATHNEEQASRFDRVLRLRDGRL